MPAVDGLTPGKALIELRQASTGCRGCELYADAQQTVFGQGPARARMVLVGEQPGDIEDRQGHPFVGPAGKLLREVLAEAGIDDRRVWFTNVVKHFRWRSAEGSSRRLHQTPTRTQAMACRPWLLAELTVLRPRVVVALGSVAATSILGPAFALTKHRGQTLDWPEDVPAGPTSAFFATIHPSAVLRAPDGRRRITRQGLVDDLARAWAEI
ncbi:UdgX family uracil-DNA binding protein [Jatrophihabitans telluris]|uniref:Type-4 uracil-DNA glycosylase n=1 Tax=Jatrophihabitans telluris TaxID=2038343 RepID=A0ABY4QUI9_9ACTN|nr:UdgX family uracil-DNA binding protein [Jatrophihabitans telluris]UQX87356.1 UdgX family uracil-DNA binding protein [Jatrophihabitans telluris]